MADDEAQGQQGSSPPAFDASTDSSVPSASFQPLVWPESRTWEEPPAPEPVAEPLRGVEPPPPPHPDVQWQATEDDADTTVHHDQALAGLGGGAEVAAPGDGDGDGDIGLISTSALPTPPVHPAAEQSSEGAPWRRFDIRRGNVAVVGLISLVSLVLLGMFLSVRARNEVPTDSSQSQRPSDQISVTGALNTVPLTTTTTAPTAAINIADLLPAVDAGAAPSSDATAADAGSGSGPSGTTATPSGGGSRSGGGGGSTTATTQPAAQAPAPTSPPATSPTVEDTTPEDSAPPPADNPPQPRRPTPTFNFPSFPQTTEAPDDDEPSYDFPSWSDIED